MKPREVLEKWIEHFNKADVEAIISLYSENSINHQVPNGLIEGRKNIYEMFKKEFAATKMTCIVENIFEDGQWAILEWKDPKGLRGCGFFNIVDGLIINQRGYWDKISFLKQENLL